MATLTLKIATLTSSIDVTDANATRVLESAFALFHQNDMDEKGKLVAYTAKQRLDWIVEVLIPAMLSDKARQFEEQRTVREAKAAAAASLAKFE